MFDSELYTQSEIIFRGLNRKAIEEKRNMVEKKVLEIIKENYANADEKGIVKITVKSDINREEYNALMDIIKFRWQRYFEEEYSFYLLERRGTMGSYGDYDTLCFCWNSVEYNIKNLSDVRAGEIIRKLSNENHTA